MSQVAASGHAVPGLQLEEGKVGSRAGSRLEERQGRQIKALGEAPLSLGDWQAGSGLAKKMGVTILCCTSYKPKYSNVQGLDLLKKMGVTLMICSIHRSTTGSGLKREICLALKIIFTSPGSLSQNLQSFIDKRPCPADGIFEVRIFKGTNLFEPPISKNLPSPSINLTSSLMLNVPC